MSKATSSRISQKGTSEIPELPLDTLEAAGHTLPRLYTIEETAAYLGVKVKRVHEYVRNGVSSVSRFQQKTGNLQRSRLRISSRGGLLPLPKSLDRKTREQVSSSPERRKSSGGSSFRALRKEIQAW